MQEESHYVSITYGAQAGASMLASIIHDLEASDWILRSRTSILGRVLGIAWFRRPSWVAFTPRSHPELEISASDRCVTIGFANRATSRIDLMNDPG